MTAINTDVGALLARTNAKGADTRTELHMRRLSSGLRVNSAADDAAGLAVANKLQSQLTGINMGIRNSKDAISLLETADGGLNTSVNIVQRMRELAVQMANDIYTSTDRTNADVEYDALLAQLNAVSSTTTFNTDNILDGSFTGTMRIGNAAAGAMTIKIDTVAVMTAGAGIDTQDKAIAAAALLDTAINTLSNAQADVGSYINRLQFNVDNLSRASVVAEKTKGVIMDADYARETSELAKQQILSQAATSMLAQANQSKSSVLALLQ